MSDTHPPRTIDDRFSAFIEKVFYVPTARALDLGYKVIFLVITIPTAYLWFVALMAPQWPTYMFFVALNTIIGMGVWIWLATHAHILYARRNTLEQFLAQQRANARGMQREWQYALLLERGGKIDSILDAHDDLEQVQYP